MRKYKGFISPCPGAVYHVEPPPAGRKLRELCNAIAFTEEHILHFFFLLERTLSCWADLFSMASAQPANKG